MPVNEMTVIMVAVDKTPVDKMSCDKKPVSTMTVIMMAVDKISGDTMPLDKMSCDKMPVDKISGWRHNACRRNDF